MYRLRAHVLWVGLIFCAGLPMFEGQAGQVAFALENSRPNIIFILTDDQRWDALGYAGNAMAHTPEMDSLAKHGAYFSHAIVTTPICAASRASIFTGLHERTHRYNFQTGIIQDKYMRASYPKVLRKSGYYTGFYGKFGVKFVHMDHLFDVYESYDRGSQKDRRGYFYKTLDNEPVHLTRYTGQKALEFIEKAPTNRPFCLSLSFSAPHAQDSAPEQYFWQEKTDHLYQDMDMPGPQLADDTYFQELPQSVREGFNRLRWTWRYDTPEKYQHSVKGYYRMIAGIDLEIGKIRQQLKTQGLDQNTVIVVMGDNGYFLGERQLAGKWLLYDNSIRVPLIVYDPRRSEHRDVDQMALNIDVPATLLDLAGVPQPATWQGKSLLPLVSGKPEDWDRDAVLVEHLWEFDHIPPSEGIRTNEWKYFRYCNDLSEQELYDLTSDPQETKNLAGDNHYQSQLMTLKAECERLIQDFSDPWPGTPTELTVETIREPENVFIQDATPEYSWVLPESVVSQKAYQILVATSKEIVESNRADVWNSTRVPSRQSVTITHQGTPLLPNTRYFWRVRAWDQDNRLSPYSKVQSFVTGRFQGSITTGNTLGQSRVSPKTILKTSESSWFIDFGKAAFGTLELKYESSTSEVLTIRLGEKLAGPNKIDRKPGGTIRYQETQLSVVPGQTVYSLRLPADKRNTKVGAVALPKALGVVIPFRYVEIENAKVPISAKDVRQKIVHTFFDEETSSFTSSDMTLNQVWDLCKYSMKATSFAGLYVDGDRERIPYEADAYINQLSHYGVDREYAMAKQTIEYFMTHPTWPTEWLLHMVLMAYQDYLYTGELELIEAWYGVLKNKTLVDLARDDGLISSFSDKVTDEYMEKLGFAKGAKPIRDIVDWPPGQKNTGWKLATEAGERDGYDMVPVNTVVNCFFYQNMVLMAELAHRLNHRADADYFKSMAAKVKHSINTKLFDSAKGIYVDGEGASHSSLHANMMALAFDLVPRKHIDSVVTFVKSRGMACSVYGSQYLLEGLYQAGEGQYALDLMRSKGDRSWWNMIRVGSTVTLEAWDMKYKPNSDWNHAWGAAPGNIIPRHLWGITPLEPGFGTVQVKPQFGDLTFSQIKVPTIRGSITGHYQRKDKQAEALLIRLPGNTVGQLRLEDLIHKDVTLNGEPVNTLEGFVPLGPGPNRVHVQARP